MMCAHCRGACVHVFRYRVLRPDMEARAKWQWFEELAKLVIEMHIHELLFDGLGRRAVFDHLRRSLIINSFQLLPKDVGADGRFIIPFEHSFNEFFPVQPIRVLPLCEIESEVFSVAGEKEYRSGKPILIPDSIRSTVGFHFPSPIHDLFQICTSKG